MSQEKERMSKDKQENGRAPRSCSGKPERGTARPGAEVEPGAEARCGASPAAE